MFSAIFSNIAANCVFSCSHLSSCFFKWWHISSCCVSIAAFWARSTAFSFAFTISRCSSSLSFCSFRSFFSFICFNTASASNTLLLRASRSLFFFSSSAFNSFVFCVIISISFSSKGKRTTSLSFPSFIRL